VFTLSKIVAPVDFSARSPAAVRFADALAYHFHSELSLLYVIEPDMAAWGSLEFGSLALAEIIESRQERAQKDMAAFLPELRPDVKRVILSGEPALRIVEYAHRENAGMIVMPTHGYGPFRRFILGSVTAKVLHDAQCPVLTGAHVAGEPRHPFEPSHVMCAIDLGPESRRVLEWAGQLAAALGSRLTVVYISPALEPFLGDAYDPRWQADLTRRANEQIETLQRDLGIKAETLVEGGNDVPGAVCFAAARVEASLLVIGRKKMAGEFLGRLRTQSYALIRQSPCPVISV